MVCACGRKDSWRKAERVLLIGVGSRNLDGSAEGSGEEWKLGSGEGVQLNGRSLRIRHAVQGRVRKGELGTRLGRHSECVYHGSGHWDLGNPGQSIRLRKST